MRRLLTILLIVAVVGAASLAPAPVYYVAPDGNDGNDGLDADKAKLTPGAVQDIPVVPGDIIYIKAGTYATQHGASDAILEADVIGTLNAPIIWTGYNTTTTTFGGIGDGTIGCVIFDAGVSALSYGITEGTATAAAYQTFRFIHCTRAAADGFDFVLSDNILLDSCVASLSGDQGAVLDRTSTVFNCVFKNNTRDGMEGGGVTFIVNNCFSYGNGGRGYLTVTEYGYSVASDNSGINFVGGVFINCIAVGGSQGFQAGTTVINCIAIGNATGIVGTAYRQSISYNNLLFGNTTDRSGWPVGVNEITGQDPLFVDAAHGDYRHQGISPALIAGADVALIDGITSRSYAHIGALAPAWIPSIHADGGQLITLTATVTTVGIPANSLYLQLDPTNDHGTSNTSSAAGATATTALVATGTVGGAVESHLVPWSIKSHSDVGTWTLDSVSVNVAGTVRTLDLTNYTWEGSGGGTTVIVIDD